MAQNRTEQHHDPTVLAMERVLEAERSADASLRACREQAETLISEARERAAIISRRTDIRISKLHGAYLNKINTEASKLLAPESTSDAESAGLDNITLVKAAQRLATVLTSAT